MLKEESEEMPKGSTFLKNTASADDTSQTLLDGKPKFVILLTRKFEFSELCEVFFGRWSKYMFLILLTIQLFLACVSYSTVAGSAWAVNIPFNFSSLRLCDQDEFMGVILPEDTPCRAAYWFCLFLFAFVVVPLSLLEPREQLIIQLLLALLRFFTIGAMIIYCVVQLIINHPYQYCPDNTTNCSVVDLKDLFFKFDYRAWLVAIPVFVYANSLQSAIPSLTHPVKQKNLLSICMHFLYGTFGLLYLSLGLTVALWFGRTIIETGTLNWVSL